MFDLKTRMRDKKERLKCLDSLVLLAVDFRLLLLILLTEWSVISKDAC